MSMLGKLGKGMLVAALAFPIPAFAADRQVRIDEPWVRATIPGQQVAGAYMRMTAGEDVSLIGGSTPIADSLELHFMRMDDGVMEMRKIETVELSKGQTVTFEPGGMHMMLIGLKKTIRAGDQIPVSLIFQNGAGRQEIVDVQLQARPAGR